jgi:hypothetical protein
LPALIAAKAVSRALSSPSLAQRRSANDTEPIEAALQLIADRFAVTDVANPVLKL